MSSTMAARNSSAGSTRVSHSPRAPTTALRESPVSFIRSQYSPSRQPRRAARRTSRRYAAGVPRMESGARLAVARGATPVCASSRWRRRRSIAPIAARLTVAPGARCKAAARRPQRQIMIWLLCPQKAPGDLFHGAQTRSVSPRRPSARRSPYDWQFLQPLPLVEPCAPVPLRGVRHECLCSVSHFRKRAYARRSDTASHIRCGPGVLSR